MEHSAVGAMHVGSRDMRLKAAAIRSVYLSGMSFRVPPPPSGIRTPSRRAKQESRHQAGLEAEESRCLLGETVGGARAFITTAVVPPPRSSWNRSKGWGDVSSARSARLTSKLWTRTPCRCLAVPPPVCGNQCQEDCCSASLHRSSLMARHVLLAEGWEMVWRWTKPCQGCFPAAWSVCFGFQNRCRSREDGEE